MATQQEKDLISKVAEKHLGRADGLSEIEALTKLLALPAQVTPRSDGRQALSVIAVFISVASIVVAVFSASYARTSANAATQTADAATKNAEIALKNLTIQIETSNKEIERISKESADNLKLSWQRTIIY